MKATHKQIVNIYKGMGYYETEWYPDMKLTVMGRPTGKEYSPVKLKTIVDTKVFDGYYDEYSDSIVDPNDIKSHKLDYMLDNTNETEV